jgi:hypothetical protein
VLLLGDRLRLEQVALLLVGLGDSWALLASTWAAAWATALRAVRGSTFTRIWPRCTRAPVSDMIWRISPEALLFTSTVVSGWIAPEAWADTTMSRFSTATAWYTTGGASCLQAAARTARAMKCL